MTFRVEAGSKTSTVVLRDVGGDKKGSPEPERVKYGRESHGTRASSNCKRQTRPLVKESAPHQQTRNYLTVIKTWSLAPDGCFIPRHTGRLTVDRNIRLES
jgi:hypothetical protein